jgi:hypothetical protein
MITGIYAIDPIIMVYVYAMRICEHTLTPGGHKLPLPIKNNYRVLTSMKHINIIGAIPRNADYVTKAPTLRKSHPTFDYFVF